MWEKFVHGLYNTAIENPLRDIPWVGLSRSAEDHSDEVYTDYMGIYIRLEFQDYLVFIDNANGDFLNMQLVTPNPVSTFGGYPFGSFHVPWFDVIIL